MSFLLSHTCIRLHFALFLHGLTVFFPPSFCYHDGKGCGNHEWSRRDRNLNDRSCRDRPSGFLNGALQQSSDCAKLRRIDASMSLITALFRAGTHFVSKFGRDDAGLAIVNELQKKTCFVYGRSSTKARLFSFLPPIRKKGCTFHPSSRNFSSMARGKIFLTASSRNVPGESPIRLIPYS